MPNILYTNQIQTVAKTFGFPDLLCKLIAAQSCVETANFTSHAFLDDKNGFGYKHVDGAQYQLSTKGIHSTESDCYASYSNFDNSIKEVCSWILRRQKEGKFPKNLTDVNTPATYAHLLKQCGYYGALESDYAAGISRWIKQL